MKWAVAAATVAGLLSLPALGDDKHQNMTAGEIRKVDKEARKITIKHGPLEKLDMPAMTMVFQVRDPAILDQVKPGDQVRFEAEKVGGGYAVTKIESR